MIRKEKEISELYDFKHIHDNYKKGYDYEDTLLENSVSKHLYDNSNNAMFLKHLNKHIVLMFEQVLLLRNMKNFFVDKYYNDHIN
jgi:hypothetical protein